MKRLLYGDDLLTRSDFAKAIGKSKTRRPSADEN